MYVSWSPKIELGAKHSAIHSVFLRICNKLEQRDFKYFVIKHLIFFFPEFCVAFLTQGVNNILGY